MAKRGRPYKFGNDLDEDIRRIVEEQEIAIRIQNAVKVEGVLLKVAIGRETARGHGSRAALLALLRKFRERRGKPGKRSKPTE
jgi:hypothetical protein